MFKASKQTAAGVDAQPRRKLTRAQRREIDTAIRRAARTDKKELSAQDSIPYQRMWPDGVCRVTDTYYTKTVQFQDINYQLSQNEDKNAIFEGWSDASTTLTAPSASSSPSSTWPPPGRTTKSAS